METICSAITKLYDELSNEFNKLQSTGYNIQKIAGYEDALWDFKIIAKDTWSMLLPTIENIRKKNETQLCECGHMHKDHLPTSSINYTAGRCTMCKCKNFLSKSSVDYNNAYYKAD